MSHCYKHPNAETELRCSKCEKYICDKCACVTTVGYRCRECAHEKSVVYSVPVPLMVGSSVLGAACGFAASYFVSHSGTFFVLFLGAIIFFGICYKFYGRYLVKTFSLDDTKEAPSVCLYDGLDYCPTHPAVLMGHHFSSIAGAGPAPTGAGRGGR